MDIFTMTLAKEGFDLTFTQPVEISSATNVKNYKIRSYRYEYKKKDIDEGIDVANQFDVQDVNVLNSQISEDGKKISLQIKDLKPGYIYELTLGEIKSRTGQPLANKLICYTLNKLRTLNKQ